MIISKPVWTSPPRSFNVKVEGVGNAVFKKESSKNKNFNLDLPKGKFLITVKTYREGSQAIIFDNRNTNPGSHTLIEFVNASSKRNVRYLN